MRNPLHPYLLTPVVVGTLSAMCAADEKPAVPVSATFQDVLRRIELRDKDSGAILTVRSRPDAPRGIQGGLKFTIHEDRAGAVVVVISYATMTADVAEQYMLAPDAAMREQLARQKVYVEQQAVKRKAWEAAQAEKILKITGGRVRYGMSPEEIKRLFGTPTDEQVWQKAGGLTLRYGETSYTFDGGLIDIEVPGPKPAPSTTE